MKAADYEAIARRRYQCPTPKRHGNYWTILVRIDQLDNGEIIRKLKRVGLCPADEPQREALRLRDEYVRTLNSDLCGVGSATAFREFVNGTYLRCESSTLAKPTLDRYKGILKNYLLPAFGDKMLRELTPATLQAYFSGFANSKLSYESVDKIRDVLAAVLRLAAGKYGLLSTNPMKDIGLPRRRVGNKPKLHISPEQFDSLVRAIQEPYATMIFTAMHSGLRVSELVALKWGDLGYDSISIDERYCRGDWGEPKSQAANATIGLSRSVVERIHASWMVEAGADPKAVQGLMRHAKIQTTLDVYAQFVPASARRAIDLTSEMAERRIAAAKVTVH